MLRDSGASCGVGAVGLSLAAAAVGLLAQIAEKGHSVVIAALAERIEDEEDEVRERAVLSC